MKKLVCVTALAVGCSAVSGLAADMTMLTKAPPAPAITSPWDIAFGSAIMSDYIFRGISQSNRKPSVAAYFEPRYNFYDSLQGYLGISAESISFPNRAAAEIDFYGGIRPTFGKLALDFGGWYYYYPGGDCFNNLAFTGADCTQNGALPVNFNVVKADVSFVEAYAKATYTFSDAFTVGASAFYSPSVLNSGANGTYAAATAKYVLPGNFLFKDVGWFISGDAGYWFLGTSDSFYCTQTLAGTCGGVYPQGIPYHSYANWDVGLGFTYKQFTLDLRYYDTNLNKGDCNAFTSAQNGSGFNNVTPINPGGAGTNWCGATFVAKIAVDLTGANLK
jgi:hypothetical protein